MFKFSEIMCFFAQWRKIKKTIKIFALIMSVAPMFMVSFLSLAG